MSTPSTITAIVQPPHSGHYSYQYPAQFVYSAQPSPNESTFSKSSRPPPSASYSNYAGYKQSPRNSVATTRPPPSQPPSTQPTPTMSGTKAARRPDWNKFFENGPPKEIIVIEDTPEPDGHDQPSRPPARVPHTQAYATHEPASKKRRTDNAYEAAPARTNPSYSVNRTPHCHGSGSETISTDRTTSLNTTAPTSLGSNGSSRSYVEASAAGQKRKRVTRQSTSDQKKREQLACQDTQSRYIPPATIFRQKEEVRVRVVKDTAARDQNGKVDDQDGHYTVSEGARLTNRYMIQKLLGQGTFGKVVQAHDRDAGRMVAIKVIRSVQKYRDASRIELRVLSTLAKNDSTNRNKCIHLRDCFDFLNHICIVTDLYGQSVFDFLKANSFVPFPSSQIQSFARQLLTSVAFLHDLNLIHTDLKPENILLVKGEYQTFTYNRNIPSSSTTVTRQARQRRVLLDTDIRLIDFGSATFDDEYHSSVVSTRHYRAPEIILNLGWGKPCDIWSIGCILVEFFTGDALFQTHDNLEHLAMMESVCDGKIGSDLIKQVRHKDNRGNANTAAKYFKNTKLDYPNKETSKASKKYVNAMKKLEEIIPHDKIPFNQLFLDLLRKVFVYDQNKRITAHQALDHPWFKASFVDDGTEAVRLKEEQTEKDLRARQQGFSNGYR